MSEIPYTPILGKIPSYFAKIQEVGVPSKADTPWLKTVGFGGGNDSYILSVLKYIGFVNASKEPTELWKKYKVPTEAREVMAQAIRMGYSDLFNLYKDANRKDREALYAYFSSKTGKAKSTIDLMVSTFSGLCALANFEATLVPSVPIQTSADKLPQSQTPLTIISGKNAPPEVHINIQLHLPPASDPAVYENLFKAMKKYLLSAED